MNNDIRVELIELVGGGRLLRLEHPSGLCLEKRLDAAASVLAQTRRLRQAFTALLVRELAAV